MRLSPIPQMKTNLANPTRSSLRRWDSLNLDIVFRSANWRATWLVKIKTKEQKTRIVSLLRPLGCVGWRVAVTSFESQIRWTYEFSCRGSPTLLSRLTEGMGHVPYRWMGSRIPSGWCEMLAARSLWHVVIMKTWLAVHDQVGNFRPPKKIIDMWTSWEPFREQYGGWGTWTYDSMATCALFPSQTTNTPSFVRRGATRDRPARPAPRCHSWSIPTPR